ncbi:hypothetical protein [Halobacteriovorax sp. HLS]|uniref:hypothetical protein n=1 Tax=Halobacteriovorax sp. HLS TaxID=2234000 RepID=UPI000FDC8748|nr:hypothetical protein [Halobacteriovorax sp. HLS]
MKVLLTIVTIFFFSSCAHKNLQKNQLKLDNHPVGTLQYWNWVKEYNLETKISTRPNDETNEYLKLWKSIYSLESKDNYFKTKIAPENFEHVFRYAVLTMPREYKIRINKHLKAIYLVRDLGVSSLAIQLKDFELENTAQFIVFMDIDVLNQKINDWFKWREMTAFKNNPEYELSPYLSHENSVIDTIHYSLFQLYGILLNWNPLYYPTKSSDLLSKFPSYKLLNESWKLENDIVVTKFSDISDDLNYLRYYSKKDQLFDIKDMLDFYENLEKTNYPNLYSFSSSSKDFVESIANYLYTTKLNHPFTIDIKKNNKIIQTHESCWQQLRCLSKKKVIEEILKENAID